MITPLLTNYFLSILEATKILQERIKPLRKRTKLEVSSPTGRELNL